MVDLLSWVQFITSVVGGGIGGVIAWYAWANFFYRKERRLFKNIQRPVHVIATGGKSLDHEVHLLRRVGFFNVGDPSNDGRAVDLINGNILVIIGYSPNSQEFKDAYTAAKQREKPVVVYADAGKILDEDMSFIKGYSNYTICNTPLRLISDVFSIMSTYPAEAK